MSSIAVSGEPPTDTESDVPNRDAGGPGGPLSNDTHDANGTDTSAAGSQSGEPGQTDAPEAGGTGPVATDTEPMNSGPADTDEAGGGRSGPATTDA